MEVVPEHPAEMHVATTIAPPGSEGAPPARALIHFRDHNSPSPYAPPEPRPRTSSGVRTQSPPRITLPPFSVLSSLLFPRIPPEPYVPLSFLAADRLQLSDAALGELDMKLYVSLVR